MGLRENLRVSVGNCLVDRGVRHGVLDKTGHNKIRDRAKNRAKDKARHEEETRTEETDR